MDLAHRLVHVIYLQRMGFLGAYDIQRRFARQHLDELLGRSGSRGHNVILLVEHNPVYTVGLRDKEYPKKTEEELKSTGAEFYRTNRGGLITYHGPGQLVAYPIINLKNFKLGVRDYVCQLQNTMIKTCKDFGVTAKSTDETGVWVEDRKIGAIGIKTQRYITTHGVALNCNSNLDWFKYIDPCGIKDKGVTSLSGELQRDVTIQETIPHFLQAFEDKFECEIEDSLLEQDEHSILPTRENFDRVVDHITKAKDEKIAADTGGV